jgi:ADP-heptose:LPS heptosyltransferase
VRPSRDTLRRAVLETVAHLLPAARRHGAPPPSKRNACRLLLIRPDHLGDVLLASPAVAALRQALPRAHLTMLVGPWSEEVAQRGAQVDEVQTCEFPGFSRQPKRNILEPYRLLLAEAGRLRGHFDVAVVLRPDHWWGALLAAMAGVPLRLGYDTPATRPFLTDALPMPSHTHAVQLNLALAARAAELVGLEGPLPAAPSALHPIFRLTDEERAWAAGIARQAQGPLVMLHPSSGSPLKSWPMERWAAVADRLAKRGARVVITGGAVNRVDHSRVAAAARSSPMLLAGVTSLGQLGALAELCALAVGTDNGPLHLAAAFGRRSVRLYGPTDEAIFGPWGPPADHVALTNSLPCRPCGNLASPPCGAHQEPPCMLGIEVGRVVDAALAHLQASPSPSLVGDAERSSSV